MAGILSIFFPKEERFFYILHKMARAVCEGRDNFEKLIKNYDNATPLERKAMIKAVKSSEKLCDDNIHRIISTLNKTFITPIDREDIHRLAVLLDDIMDYMEAIAVRLDLYRIKKLPRPVIPMTELIVSSIGEVERIVYNLRNMKRIQQHTVKIHTLENQADSLLNESVAELFNKNYKPVDIIKFKELYEWLETITDRCEDVADVVESIVIKYA